MKKQLLLLALIASCPSIISAASIAWPIQVSPNGRYFVDQKGQPVHFTSETSMASPGSQRTVLILLWTS